MKLLIPIDQKASIKAGYDAPNSTEKFELDPATIPVEIRNYIAEQYNVSTGSLANSTVQYSIYNLSVTPPKAIAPLSTEVVLDWLRQYYTAHCNAVTAHETRIANELSAYDQIRPFALRAAELARESGETDEAAALAAAGWHAVAPNALTFARDMRTPHDPVAELTRVCVANRDAKRDQAYKEMREREAAKAAAIKAEIRNCLLAHGTPDQLERFDAGVLPDAEWQALMKADIFAPLDSFGRYLPLTHKDIDSNLTPAEREIVYETDAKAIYRSNLATEIPANTWARKKCIAALMPAAIVEVWEHEGSYDHDNVSWAVSRFAIHVIVQRAGIQFTCKLSAE